MCIYTNVIKYIWTYQHYINADTRFQNNLYSQVIDRHVHPGSFCEVSLVPSCIYMILCITLMFLWNVTNVKLLLLMQWLLYCDHHTAYVVILDMTSSTTEPFRRSGFGVWQRKALVWRDGDKGKRLRSLAVIVVMGLVVVVV